MHTDPCPCAPARHLGPQVLLNALGTVAMEAHHGDARIPDLACSTAQHNIRCTTAAHHSFRRMSGACAAQRPGKHRMRCCFAVNPFKSCTHNLAATAAAQAVGMPIMHSGGNKPLADVIPKHCRMRAGSSVSWRVGTQRCPTGGLRRPIALCSVRDSIQAESTYQSTWDNGSLP